MKQRHPQSADLQSFLRDTEMLAEPLLAQIFNSRVRLTPVLWVQRFNGNLMELAIGQMRRPAWLKAGRSVTIEVVSPFDGELVTVCGDILQVARGQDGTSVFLELADMTLTTNIKLTGLINRVTKPTHAIVDLQALDMSTEPANERPQRRRRLISGVRMRSDVLAALPAGMPPLPKAVND